MLSHLLQTFSSELYFSVDLKCNFQVVLLNFELNYSTLYDKYKTVASRVNINPTIYLDWWIFIEIKKLINHLRVEFGVRRSERADDSSEHSAAFARLIFEDVNTDHHETFNGDLRGPEFPAHLAVDLQCDFLNDGYETTFIWNCLLKKDLKKTHKTLVVSFVIK